MMRSAPGVRRVVWLVFGAAAVLFLTSCHGGSHEWTVNTTSDGSDATPGDGVCEMTAGTGDCSLRAAIDEANATGGTEHMTITIPSGTYALAPGAPDDTNQAGDLDVDAGSHQWLELKAEAPGAVIDAAGNESAFSVTGGHVVLQGVALTGSSGAGSTVASGGTLSAHHSAFHDNEGPGISGESGSETLLSNTTVSNNGGAGITTDGTLFAGYITVMDNGTGGLAGAGTAELFASVLAGQVAGADCSLAVTSMDYNLDTDDTCGFNAGNDTSGASPAGLLGLSSDLVPFNHPIAGSPLIDAVPTLSAYCDSLFLDDQDHGSRPVGTACDRGAIEADFSGLPVADDDTATVGEDGPSQAIDVLGNDSDPDLGDVLDVSSLDTTGTVGSVTNNGADVDYDPGSAFNSLAAGETATDTFSYTAVDAAGGTDTATVTVTITGVNDDPTAGGDSGAGFGTDEDSAFTTVSVLGNDTDPDTTDVLTAGSLDVTGTLGTVIDNGDGTFSYDPNGQFEALNDGDNATDSFQYTVSDGEGGSDAATVTIAIAGVTDNVDPSADDDGGVGFTTDEDSSFTTDSVLDNDTDANPGQTLSVLSIDTTGTLGSVTDNGDGTFDYDPDGLYESLGVGQTASTTFEYTVSDGNGGTDVGLVTITITGANDAPTASDDSGSMSEDAVSSAINVLGNDTDPDSGDTKTVVSVGTPTNGGSVTNNGTNVSFTPGASFQDLQVGENDSTQFTYTMQDAAGVQSTASVTITVTGVNDNPVADDETFSASQLGGKNAIGNTTFVVGATAPGTAHVNIGAHTVLTGDTDIEGDTLTVTAGTFATTQGGSITIAANGTFTYLPAAGFEGNDTHSYTLNDGNGGTDTGLITIAVDEVVWYVDDSAVAGGTGKSNAPFQNLQPLTTGGSADAVDESSDYIFVYSGTYQSAGGGIVLEAGQRLYGEPNGLTIAATTLVPAGGSNPVIANTTAGGDGIVLASGADVQRVNPQGSADDGISGSAITTATIGSNIVISGNGGTEVEFTGAAGGNISIGATISNGAAGRLVEVQNRSSGSVSFAGSVTDTSGTGTGILLNSNTGASIVFNGAVQIVTNGGSNPAFTATGGGTVSNSNAVVNTLSASGSAALNVTNTTSGGLTFQSISANGGANGIVMTSAGSGGLTVTGTGSAGSGGTIQNTTARGGNFVSASNISLTRMNLTNAATSDFPAAPTGLSLGNNTGDNAALHFQGLAGVTLNGVAISGSAEHGINIHEVTTFSLLNSSITNVGNAADEDGIHAFNLRGTVNVTGTTVTSSGDDNLNMQFNTPLTALPVPTATVTVSGGSYNTGVLGSGVLFGVRATSNVNIHVTGVTINNNFSGGVVADTYDFATSNIEVDTSTITNNNDAIAISGNHGHTNFDIHNMTNLSGQDFVNISILKAACTAAVPSCGTNPSDGSFGTLEGYIRNNPVIVTENGHTADGMFLFNAGKGQLNVVISGNTMDYAGTQRAIAVQGGQDGASTINLTATGNNIDIKLDGAGNAVNGILAQSQVADPSGAGSSLCADIGGAGALSNTFTHSLGGSLAGGDIRARQRFSANIALRGYTGGAQDTTAAASYLDGRNSEVSASTASTGGPPGGFTNTSPAGAACTQPT